jgi:N-hydroxyarylamine O-acetyltransferase
LNVETYLKRIDYQGSVAPTAENLRRLQLAHLIAVPFENLSIHAREPIVLADGALFTKIVANNRGGFCYEANGLFAALLRALGFEVTLLSAEVAGDNGGYSAPFDHMTLLVTLEKRWLVDVGFGDSFREPLLLDDPGEQSQVGCDYRLSRDGSCVVLSRRETQGVASKEWRAQYRFTLQSFSFADFAERCRFHQTSPESHFTRARVCSRATESGRITLSELRLITSDLHGGRQERDLESEAEYKTILRDQFGIIMKN